MWIINIILIYFFIRSICVVVTRNKIVKLENKFCDINKTKEKFLYYDSLPGYLSMLINITKSLEYYTVTEKDLTEIYEIKILS